MNNKSNIDLIGMEQNKRALIFIDKLENEKDIDKKVKLLVNMMTYYDKINAKNFADFCMDIYQDRAIYSRDCKLQDKIKELLEIIEK